MTLTFREAKTNALFSIISSDDQFEKYFFSNRDNRLLTIAWNKGEDQGVTIDEARYTFPKNTILPLMVNQSFRFERPVDIVALQFNREFYCIVNHDKEVGCVGFLFYGSLQPFFIVLDRLELKKFEGLLSVFEDEMKTEDDLQAEMLRILLKRVIIKTTRLAKQQYLNESDFKDDKLDTIRSYNLLVENHYKKEHEVQFYAKQLNKSPKTFSNLFALYNHKSPLQVIHDRIVLEAKRLFYYTDKSAKEVAYELGFEDFAHFSNFFKKNTGYSPSQFKQKEEKLILGKN